MRELRLNDEDGLDDDLLYLMPNDLGMLPINLAVAANALELALENIFEPVLMQATVKLFIIFIEGVIRQMNVGVVIILCVIILLRGQSHETIVVDINRHGADDGCY